MVQLFDISIFGLNMLDSLLSSNGFQIVSQNMGNFLKGTVLTLEITALSVGFGMILGLIAALLKMSRYKLVALPGIVYIDFFRGTPLFVQILLFYFGVLPLVFDANSFQAAVIVCSLNSGAYIAEIVRAGIQAVERGQMEAARSLGMTHTQAMWHVILPQAYKIVIPPMVNEFIALLKDTSLVAVIGAEELTHQGRILVSVTYEAAWIWGTVAVIYLILTRLLSTLGDYLERRLATE
jgi:glutamine transport system permease protein